MAATRDVAMLVFATALLRWPDRTQGQAYLSGFRVVGNLDAPAVFRSIQQPPVDLEASFYGAPALAEVAALRRAPAPRDAD